MIDEPTHMLIADQVARAIGEGLARTTAAAILNQLGQLERILERLGEAAEASHSYLGDAVDELRQHVVALERAAELQPPAQLN